MGTDRSQESVGLALAIMAAYLALVGGAVLAFVAIKPNRRNDEPSVGANSCDVF
jgi:hypothetical protein